MYDMISHGLMEVHFYKNVVVLHYVGNMGHTIDFVREKFDEIYHKGAFDMVETQAFAVDGTPDYSYSMRINRKSFDSVVQR
tara:strand:- start:1000 stop:1242 length:243 start_codon:yes stop_codon:yes gene_type:complete